MSSPTGTQGRVPPCDLNAEAGILSAVLCAFDRAEQSRLMGDLVQALPNQSSFYGPQHAVVWSAMLASFADKRPIDIITLNSLLSATGRLEKAGGVRYLAQLQDEIPATSYPLEYARVVAEHARVRRTIAALETAAALGYGTSPDEAAAYLSRVTASVRQAVGDVQSQDQWITGAEIFAQLPPIPWVCQGLALGPGRPHTLVGFGYSGKTVAAQALALAVASGTHAWGRFPCRQGIVLHLDHEVGKRGTLRRYQRLAFALQIAPHHLEERLRILPLPRVRLSDPGAEEWYTKTCTGAALCIIDSLRACIGGDIDENDSTVRSYLDILLRVSEVTGCTFIVLHHAGKGRQEGDQREAGRGSSAIYDASGTVLKLDPEKHGEPHVTVSKVQATKMAAEASGGSLEPFWLRIADIASDDGADDRAGLSCAFVETFSAEAVTSSALMNARKETILEVLAARPDGLSKEQVRFLATGSKLITDQALLSLELERKVCRTRRLGKKGGGDLWILPSHLPVEAAE